MEGDASVTFRLWVGFIRESDRFVLISKQKKYTFIGCSPWGRTELDTTEAT